MNTEPLQETIVECHSGYAYCDQPRALYWQGQRLEITSIIKQWRTPESKWFLVKASDNITYEINYNEASDTWQIQPV